MNHLSGITSALTAGLVSDTAPLHSLALTAWMASGERPSVVFSPHGALFNLLITDSHRKWTWGNTLHYSKDFCSCSRPPALHPWLDSPTELYLVLHSTG